MIKKNLLTKTKHLMAVGLAALTLTTTVLPTMPAFAAEAESTETVTSIQAAAPGYTTNTPYKLKLSVDGVWRYYDNAFDDTYNGLAENEYGWWYVRNGEIDFNYTGMACNEYGWWYVKNGALDWNYTGMACNEYGWWYFVNGGLDFSYSGMGCNDIGWWKYNNGTVDFGFNGLACNEYGWWYIRNGLLDFSYTGMACNDYGWWYVRNGALDWNYTGMASNDYGWWYYSNGSLDMSFNGVAFNENGAWVYQNGRMNFDYNGTVDYEGKTYNVVNSHVEGLEAEKEEIVPETPPVVEEKTGTLEYIDDTWRYVVDGNVDYGYTGLAANDNGWFYLKDGTIDWNCNTVASNQYGTWKVLSGSIDFDFSGRFTDQYWVTYDVEKGKVTNTINDKLINNGKIERRVHWYDTDGTYLGCDIVEMAVDGNGNVIEEYKYTGYKDTNTPMNGHLKHAVFGSAVTGTEFETYGRFDSRISNLNLKEIAGDANIFFVYETF